MQLTTGDVSVKPYPCKVGNPIAFKNEPTSLSSAPPPEINAFKFPPNCFLIFFLTNFSQIKLIKFSLKENFFILIFFSQV